MDSQGILVNRISSLLMSIAHNGEDTCTKLLEVTAYLKAAPDFAVQQIQRHIIGALNAFVTKVKHIMDSKTKSAVLALLNTLFKKTRVDEVKVFLFAYKYLLEEVYDHKQHNCVALIDEDAKLEVIQTMILLSKALTLDVLEKVYQKDSALVLCQMIYVALEIAKSEQYRSLRIASIECIMCLAQVDDSSDFTNLELRSHIADTFMLFLPGITTSLAKIAIEDEKHGHAIVMTAVKAWGRIVTLQMQNYNTIENSTQIEFKGMPRESICLPKVKWKTPEEVKEYLDNSKRNLAWYKETDEKLYTIMSSFSKLTHHSHLKVRKQLMETSMMLIEHCYSTIPKTSSIAINHIITLSEDADTEVSELCREILTNLSKKLSEGGYSSLFQNLEENLFTAVMALPRVFNTLDESEQLSAINLIIGYLRVFGKTTLAQVLQLPSQVKHLIEGLIYISKMDTKNVQLHDEYVFDDLDESHTLKTPWKNFRYFRKDIVQFKIEQACSLLASCGASDIAIDLLMEYFINCADDRKEASLLLNSVIFGLPGAASDSRCITDSILDLYMDPDYWNMPLDVTPNTVISEVQNNIIQICLQLEGLGKIALVMQQEFEQKMLKTLYPVFEYAGSNHSLIRSAASLAIKNISDACGYNSIYHLINKNMDYLTYHILRKLHKRDETGSALKALGAVIKYGDIDTLHFFIGDLLHSCDKFFRNHNVEAYLHIFQMVIKSVKKALHIEINIEPIKSKKQKELEHEPFRISNISSKVDNEDDDKCNEECNENNEECLADDNNVAPPIHVKLTEDLLMRCVHFLPSKKRFVKILVIEIFKDGLEILRDWDNNLLPLVHQVWSPLVDRFKEQDDYVLINYSFQLLIVLARLSKDFIRSRTLRDVLPNIRQILAKLVQSSYRQDKGAAYRYTQAYKLQLFVLQNLGRVIIDLDVPDKDFVEMVKAIFPYLSKYQPIPLQEASLSFYSDIIKFDADIVKSVLHELLEALPTNEKLHYEKNNSKLLDLYK